MPDLLLELSSEEIPARLQARVGADLERLMTTKLKDAGLTFDRAESFAGPRRLTLHIEGLPFASPDTREERKGPKVGAPDKAVQGFLRGAGLSDISEAQVLETKKGEVYVAIIEKKGRAATEVIGEALTETVRDFPWPKSQRWGDGDLRWVRPLRSVLLAFGGEAMPFTLENGGQPIEASLETVTHRVLGRGPIEAADFDTYERRLEEGRVVLRADERKARILDGANALCADAGLELVEDQGLLTEVAGLAEWPTPLLGAFDEKFLALPDEVITAAMRGHQKYFSVRDPKTGRLAPRFVCVADIDGGAGMLAGYERVLTARLSDALFLYQNDLRKPLEEHAEKLSGTTFFEGLGTLADKVERVAALARELAPACGADPDKAERAAHLAKADLASEMVYEFPELQGLMGRYYALEQGIDEDIADAIRDHYKPAGQSDDLPTNPLGTVVSLADKLDTLAAFWSIGKKPTGSGDPFALRRAALSIVRTITSLSIRFNATAALDRMTVFASTVFRAGLDEEVQDDPHAGGFAVFDDEMPSDVSIGEFATQLGRQLEEIASRGLLLGGARISDRVFVLTHSGSRELCPSTNDFRTADLLAFFHDRLSVYFRDQGFRHDHIAAALEEGADDFVLIEKKLKALASFLGTEEGANLTAAYKRASNILKAEEKKTGLPETAPNPDLFEQDEERALHNALDAAQAAAEKALAAEDFDAAMTALAQVRGPLDQFFEAVTVNADNPDLRTNRLAQLLRFKRVVKQVADFDRLEG
ncbi:MAG: glycine--tRNA ligase subunit beta [Pseudomonadota bacterium]